MLDPTRTPQAFGSAMPAQAWFWLVAFIPAYGLAVPSWRYFEQPILRLKRFFPTERKH